MGTDLGSRKKDGTIDHRTGTDLRAFAHARPTGDHGGGVNVGPLQNKSITRAPDE